MALGGRGSTPIDPDSPMFNFGSHLGESNSARRILETVAANNGTLTWYNIVKTVDQFEDVERVPPSFYVLQDLIQHGYLAIDPPEEGNQAKYWMTKLGLDSLGRGKTSEKDRIDLLAGQRG